MKINPRKITLVSQASKKGTIEWDGEKHVFDGIQHGDLYINR
jgi:hypothetical protein